MPKRVVDPIYVPGSVTTTRANNGANPLVTNFPVPHGQLLAVDLQIPPGHSGTTGIQFRLSGQLILPYASTAAWIIGDDLHEIFDVDVEVDRTFQVVTRNDGFYDHSHYFRLKIRQLAPSSLPAPVKLVEL